MNSQTTEHCFLLTCNYRDLRQHGEIELYGKSVSGDYVRIIITDAHPCFFIERQVVLSAADRVLDRRQLPMSTLSENPVDCLYFRTHADALSCAGRLRSALWQVYESDIHPADRYLMERMVFGGFSATGQITGSGASRVMVNPKIRGTEVTVPFSILSLDIETNAHEGIIYSIACSGLHDKVFMRGKGDDTDIITFCGDESGVLTSFVNHLSAEDPDIIIGWNVVDFDLKVLYDRFSALGVPFTLGRNRERPDSVFTTRGAARTIARISGRVIMDVPLLLRTYYHAFEEYSLQFVATELLGASKEITVTGSEKIEAINHLFATDKQAFASYNLSDTHLTRAIFDKTDLLQNAASRSRRSGQTLDRSGGSIATFDYIYLPRLHRAGFVAPDAFATTFTDEALPGGYVIEPSPGIYDNVLVFDFRSLYPSIIKTFLIDPLGLRHKNPDRQQGPCGPSFARTPSLLPVIISELLDARTEAKQNNNLHLSQAIKILMNSFYGVLGARNCRFFSVDLATTITRTGQHILKKSIDIIENAIGFPVIYGDTDSLFIHLGKEKEDTAQSTGVMIATEVTRQLTSYVKSEFGAESSLLLQFETHFRHFLIPSVRGAQQGSKKHYCGGSVVDGTLRLFFKGMESARSDWTDLAKEVQHELIMRVFTGRETGDYLIGVLGDLRQGRSDEKLVYKKRIRKNLDEYTQVIPPHIQAARLLKNPPHLIRYLITTAGPQPLGHLTAPPDYEHYIDSQLQPVADSVLELVGSSFEKLTSGQLDLFG